jgi:perosamine synthetase
MLMISIYEPDIKNYCKSAIGAINSGWISNHGEYINLSTNKLSEFLNCKYSILMANGTCATHCLFLSIKYKYPEINKIYVPNNAYVAAWNSALMVYSIERIEVMKMNIDTWNIETNEEYIRSLDKNAAVLIVHNLGNIINVPRLKKIRPDLIFVEDNCEGLFGKYENIYSGTSDDTLCASVSFYGNKIITTGEGGAFITNHQDIFDHIKKVYSQGMSSIRYLHDVHAYNYRMTNIQAAFLYDQLNDIDNILSNKKRIFNNYEKLLEQLIDKGQISLFKKEFETENACWIFAIRIIGNTKSIEETTDFFKKNNVDIRPFFYPINKHEHLTGIENNDEASFLLNKEIIMIPSSPSITMEEQTYIVDIIDQFV